MAETFLHTVVAAATEYAIDVDNIVGNEYGWATVTRPPGPSNTCNTCDPAIPDTLYVTLAGLSGDFAYLNGTHTLSWRFICTWGKPIVPGLFLNLTWVASSGVWRVASGGLVVDAWCLFNFESDTGHQCEPEAGTYSWNYCIDINCADHDSCEDSVAGSTCVVSLV